MSSSLKNEKAFVFHTDMGAVVIETATVTEYGVEHIIKDRAISQARAVQFLNQAKQASPNDPKAARTLGSVYTQVDVLLPD